MWGVTVVDRGTVILMINGRAITAPTLCPGLGDVLEVGFVWKPTSNVASCQFTDLIIERNSDPLGRSELAEVRIFGDSTSDYLVGAWPDDFKDMLDMTFGVKLGYVTNLAVSGTNTLDALHSIQSNGLGNAYYVVVAVGTNDIQSGSPLSATTSNMQAIIQAIQSQGRIPVIVSPYMWYTQAQVGQRGQASTNYDQGAPYRSRIARLCAELGAIWVDLTRELPEPKPSYVTADIANDPLVRDNVHPSALGYKLYAWAIARAIASHHAALAKDKDYFVQFPAEWLQSGWSLGASSGIWQNNKGRTWLQGNLGAGSKSVGSVIVKLPRWALPAVQQSFICSSDGGPIEIIVYTNGNVALGAVPSNFSLVNLNNVSFGAC